MTSELTAVADAIRTNDRFLLVTHENPDGDAFGSILGTKLALDLLDKDSVMYLSGDLELPDEYSFLDLNDLRRELPPNAGERVVLALDCAPASRTVFSMLAMSLPPTPPQSRLEAQTPA